MIESIQKALDALLKHGQISEKLNDGSNSVFLQQWNEIQLQIKDLTEKEEQKNYTLLSLYFLLLFLSLKHQAELIAAAKEYLRLGYY